MATLKIKLCELNRGDVGSIKSMFHLTASQRKQDWEIVSSGEADLCIYSFESEKSITAWQKHGYLDGMAVLFSTNEDVDVAMDMVLKKPLRTKNFAEVLNKAAKQIKLASNIEKISDDDGKKSSTEEVALEEIYAAEKKTVKKESLMSSVSSSLSKRLTRKKSSHRQLPDLELTLPEQAEKQSNLIVELNVLEQAIEKCNKDDDSLISLVLGNLVPLNRAKVPAKTHIAVLEFYRKTTFSLMRGWEAKVNLLEDLSHADYLKSAHALALLIDELAIGYKILLMDAYNKGQHPKSKDSFLIAISRVAEYSGLHILHSYCFFRTPSPEKVHTLHQLYLCCEAAKVLATKVSTKDDRAAISFSAIYNQIILTSIADPFRLSKVDILKLYRLMAKYTSKIKISALTDEQKQPVNDAVMVGNFIINTSSDSIPVSLEKLSTEDRNLPNTRLLNTHSVLTAIEIIFQQAASSTENDVYSSEIQLLKKVIPHLNTSYERQFERFPLKDNAQVNLVKNLTNIHSTLKANKLDPSNNWNIHNRGLGGMMVSTKASSYHQLDVGNFYGIFGTQDSPLLALVRWLRIDEDNIEMGLELHRGHPVAVACVVENDVEQLPLLILRDEKQADKLIAPKGLIAEDQALQLTENDKIHIISIDTLIDTSFDYDHFSFTVI